VSVTQWVVDATTTERGTGANGRSLTGSEAESASGPLGRPRKARRVWRLGPGSFSDPKGRQATREAFGARPDPAQAVAV
jgi:hypothetical protein